MSFFPRPAARLVWRILGMIRNAVYDAHRLTKGSTVLRSARTKAQQRSGLLFDFHKLEKGLSLPNMRPGFGQDAVRNVLREVARYEREFGADTVTIAAREALFRYQQDAAPPAETAERLREFLGSFTPAEGSRGGSLPASRESLFPVSREVATTFLTSRHSVRNFTGEAVSRELIEEAARLAQCAPSVCNRQSGRVYVTNEPEKIARVLNHQNGNRGFNQVIGAVFVVASDLSAFRNVDERNQPFVDGGIYAMALLQGLHALGLGASMLNWSQKRGPDLALRREFGIAEEHVVITMIGVGIVPDGEIRVAGSPRVPVADTITWL